MDNINVANFQVAERMKLTEAPHVVAQFRDLVVGDWKPTSSDLDHLLAHAVECEECTKKILYICKNLIQSDETDQVTKTMAEQVHTALAEAFYEMQAKKDIPAYIELLQTQGEQTANEKFPAVTEHLEKCPPCKKEAHEAIRVKQ